MGYQAQMLLICVMVFSNIDIGQCCHHPAQRNCLENPATLGTTRIIYGSLVNIPGLYISWGKLKATHRVQAIDDRWNSRITDTSTDIS